jgi:hypothetical protein
MAGIPNTEFFLLAAKEILSWKVRKGLPAKVSNAILLIAVIPEKIEYTNSMKPAIRKIAPMGE